MNLFVLNTFFITDIGNMIFNMTNCHQLCFCAVGTCFDIAISLSFKHVPFMFECFSLNFAYYKNILIGIFSSPEPSGSQGELIVYPCSVVRPSAVRPSVVRPSSTIYKDLLL